MGNLLETLSRIPDCIPAQPELGPGAQLRGQLERLNQMANDRREASASDDNFSADDFAYARSQSWGRFLNHFGSYANFRSVLTQFIDREMQSNVFCTCTGEVIRTPEGTARCIENVGPTPSPQQAKPKEKAGRSGHKSHHGNPQESDPPLKKAEGTPLGEMSWAGNHLDTRYAPLPEPEDTRIAGVTSPEQFAAPHSMVAYAATGATTLTGAGFIRRVVNGILRQLQGQGGIKNKDIDIVFVVDHSGSMEWAGQMVASSVYSIVSEFESRGAGKVRFGLVGFSDVETKGSIMPLTPMNAKSLADLSGRIKELNYEGGREPVGWAASQAISLFENTEDSQSHARQVMIITDEEGINDSEMFTTSIPDAMREGAQRHVAVNLFSIGGIAPPKRVGNIPGHQHVPQLNGIIQFLQDPNSFYYYHRPPKAWGSR